MSERIVRDFMTGPMRVFRLWRRLAVLTIAVMLGCVGVARAQDKAPALRVVVSNSGKAILESLLDTMTTRAGLGGQVSVTYADPLNALRNFCQNGSGTSPDIVLATQRMQSALATECSNNGVGDVAVVELGRSALILAVRSGSLLTRLTSRQVYLALARDVPTGSEFVRNISVRWSDVDPSLPTDRKSVRRRRRRGQRHEERSVGEEEKEAARPKDLGA